MLRKTVLYCIITAIFIGVFVPFSPYRLSIYWQAAMAATAPSPVAVVT